MPSSHTPRNRLEKQNPGENDNQWGERLNDHTIEMTDIALDGWGKFTLSDAKTLSTANGQADEARVRVLHVTGGTGGTVTLPAVEKAYFVINQASGAVTFTVGGTDAVVPAGALQWIASDGSDVYTSATPVLLTGAQTIAGLKTFSDGIAINGQTLDGLTAAGKALAEGADAGAQRTSLGLGSVATLDKASTSQTRAASGDAALVADNIKNASAVVSLSDASTVAVDWTAGVNFDVTLAGNRTLGNPTNVVAGTMRTVMVKGDNSTDRSLAFASNYKAPPALNDIDNGQYYLLTLYAYTTTHIVVSAIEAL